MSKRERTVPLSRAMRARRDGDEVRKTVDGEVAELEQLKRDNFLGDDVEDQIRNRELPTERELAVRRLIIHVAGQGQRTKHVA